MGLFAILFSLPKLWETKSTILHSDKDLAVSLPLFPEGFTLILSYQGTLRLLSERHCSHLDGYPRRELPATSCPPKDERVSGLSSLALLLER